MTKRILRLIHRLLADDFGVDADTYQLILDLIPAEGQEHLGKMVESDQGMVSLLDIDISFNDFEKKIFGVELPED